MFVGITEALKHHPKGDFSKIQIIDLCSGMGGFTIGSQVLGL
jgi:predicted RNA methylase